MPFVPQPYRFGATWLTRALSAPPRQVTPNFGGEWQEIED
jgi:hypothetical protein